MFWHFSSATDVSFVSFFYLFYIFFFHPANTCDMFINNSWRPKSEFSICALAHQSETFDPIISPTQDFSSIFPFHFDMLSHDNINFNNARWFQWVPTIKLPSSSLPTIDDIYNSEAFRRIFETHIVTFYFIISDVFLLFLRDFPPRQLSCNIIHTVCFFFFTRPDRRLIERARQDTKVKLYNSTLVVIFKLFYYV